MDMGRCNDRPYDTLMTHFLHPSILFMAVALVLPVFGQKAWRWVLFIPPVAAIVLSLELHTGGYWSLPYLEQRLILGRVDALSILFVNLFAIQSLICVMFAFHRQDKGHHMASNFYVAGAFGAVLAGDYWTLLMFWTVMTISSTFLIWLHGRPLSVAAGFRYLLILSTGLLLLLAGILLKEQTTPTLALHSMNPAQMRLCDWLILIGFCINAGLFPLHAWLTDAYPEATCTGVVFLTAFAAHVAVYALIRCFAGQPVLVPLGCVSALWGIGYALIQRNIFRLLAYLMVSQIGIMVAGIGIGTPLTLNGAVAHAYAHTLYSGLLFMAMAALVYSAEDTDLSKLTGSGRRAPLIMTGYMVGALSLCCLPLLSGFISVPMIIQGAVEAHRYGVAVCLGVAVLGTALSIAFRVPVVLLRPPDTQDRRKPAIPINMPIAIGKAALATAVLGAYPGVLYPHLPYDIIYKAFTLEKLTPVLILLGFTALGFMVFHRSLQFKLKSYPDMEAGYRFIGKALYLWVARPLAWLDGRWSALYRMAGLSGLMALARGVQGVDQKCIDPLIDGTAKDLRRLSRLSAKPQTRSLQTQLCWMIVLGLGMLLLYWVWG